MKTSIEPGAPPLMTWQLKLGIGLLAVSIIFPVIALVVLAMLDISGGVKATLTGSFLVGGDVLGVLSIAVMGKSGYLYIKTKVFAFLKQHGPPASVSLRRYRIGLMLFSIPILFSWLSPYVMNFFPRFVEYPIFYAVIGDLLLIISLFVLGGDFWEKVRGLFIHDQKCASTRKIKV